MLARMGLRATRVSVLLFAAGLCCAAQAVPLGYRYVGSRVVSEGRVVLWYWNVDYLEVGPYGVSFVARMHARAVDVNQERPFVAIVRCDSATYRPMDDRGRYQTIDEGEPIHAVWRAGCDKGVAVDVRQRYAFLDAVPATANASAAAPVTAHVAAPVAPPVTLAQAPAAPAAPADPRRADPCIRFAETRGAPAGDATITNTCSYPIEVTLCYKGGGGGAFDCPTPARGRHGDSLGPGITHVLPEFRRGRNKGINVVACRGSPGTVFPRLDDAAKSGCFS
ncbi:MAG: hypothetical protein IT518_15770 [Burkholderiales bacterium]|nr:hypothetical protein [Burkholderiales bacterium]